MKKYIFIDELFYFVYIIIIKKVHLNTYKSVIQSTNFLTLKNEMALD